MPHKDPDPPFLNWPQYYLNPDPSPLPVPDPIFTLAASRDLDSIRAILRLFPEKAYLHYELNGLLPIHMAASCVVQQHEHRLWRSTELKEVTEGYTLKTQIGFEVRTYSRLLRVQVGVISPPQR